jgi:hypothetical protein
MLITCQQGHHALNAVFGTFDDNQQHHSHSHSATKPEKNRQTVTDSMTYSFSTSPPQAYYSNLKCKNRLFTNFYKQVRTRE